MQKVTASLFRLIIMLPIILLPIPTPASPYTPQGNENQLPEIYQGRQQTFFCDCTYALEDSKKTIAIKTCSLQPPLSDITLNQVEWSNIIPPERFARQLDCWHSPEQFKECKISPDASLTAMKCCALVSTKFNAFINNVHNVVPALATINTLRKNLEYAQVTLPDSQVNLCNSQIDSAGGKFEPAQQVKGDIARTYLYFDAMGSIHLKRREKRLFEIWDMLDPVDSSECEIQFRKAKIQGDSNPYIANRCR